MRYTHEELETVIKKLSEDSNESLEVYLLRGITAYAIKNNLPTKIVILRIAELMEIDLEGK